MKKVNWLLLRGLAREVGHWGSFASELQVQPYCQEALALDLPGVGTEKTRRAPLSIAANCEDLRRRWKKKRNESEWGIMGVSLGGMIALDWVSRYPYDFNLGVFINTSSRDSATAFERLQPQYLNPAIKALFQSDIEEREKEILRMTSNLKPDDPNVQALWTQIAKTNPVHLSTTLFQLLAAARFSAPQELSRPVLFLASKADKMVHYKASVNLSEKYNSPLQLHESAGHDLPLDDPHWIFEQIKNFCSQLR